MMEIGGSAVRSVSKFNNTVGIMRPRDMIAIVVNGRSKLLEFIVTLEEQKQDALDACSREGT